MNRAIIDNRNSLVTGRDVIYILDDFIYKGKGGDANRGLYGLY